MDRLKGFAMPTRTPSAAARKKSPDDSLLVAAQRRMQRAQAARDARAPAKPKKKPGDAPVQAGARKQPANPLPG